MSITALTLLVSDVLLSGLQLVSVFNEIAKTMNAEGRTELTPEEWERITSQRKAAVTLMQETE